MLGLKRRQQGSFQISGNHVNSIAIWQFGGVGDMLLVTPVILALSKRFPKAEIHIWCSDPKFATFLKNFSQVKAVHTFVVYDFDARTLLHRAQRQALHRILEDMRLVKPDLLVNLHVPALLDWWAVEWWLMRRLCPAFLMGFHPETVNNGSLLDVSLSAAERKGIHYTTLYQKLLGKADITCGVDTVFPVTDASHSAAKELLEQSGVTSGYVCVHMGGRRLKMENKMWETSSFIELAQAWVDDGIVPVLIGVESEQEAGKMLCQAVPQAINIIGKTSMGEMAAVIKQARLFVGHDSGPFHIAVAVNTPAVAICGRPNAEPEYIAYDKDDVVVLIGDAPEQITVDDVYQKAKGLLA